PIAEMGHLDTSESRGGRRQPRARVDELRRNLERGAAPIGLNGGHELIADLALLLVVEHQKRQSARAAVEDRGACLVPIAPAQHGLDAFLARLAEPGALEPPRECSGHAEREEQRADLHLQVVREDREQLAKAAALAATPDTTGEATAGSQ